MRAPNRTSSTSCWTPARPAPTTTRTTRAAPTGTHFTNDDRFNFRPFNYLATPNRRVNVFGKAAYDVADNVELTFTASFTNRESSGQAAPNPLFMGSGAGAGFFLDNVFIPADHPFNPFGINLGPDAITPGGTI